MPPHEIIAVEDWLGEGRCDLISRLPGVGLVITDTKVTLALDEKDMPRRVREYDASWQLYDYGWHVRDKLGETPVWGAIQLVTLTPRTRCQVFEVIRFDDAKLDRWHESAIAVWDRMAEDEELGFAPMHFTGCHTQFGVCDFHPVCHRGADLSVF